MYIFIIEVVGWMVFFLFITIIIIIWYKIIKIILPSFLLPSSPFSFFSFFFFMT